MTNIKELAEQAGFDIEKTMYGEKVFVDGRGITKELERFAELVRQDEREACAKVCESKLQQTPYGGLVAAAIRARRDKHD